MNNTDRDTGQPVGEWIVQDPVNPETNAMFYRGKLAVLLDRTEKDFRDYRTIRCMRCVASRLRTDNTTIIHRWMILPP